MTIRTGVQFSGYSKRVHDEDGTHEVWIETCYVGASDDVGHNWALDGSDTEDEAQAQRALLALDGSTPATEPHRWVELEPSYGSDAWDGEAEFRLACFEAECFNEPPPRW